MAYYFDPAHLQALVAAHAHGPLEGRMEAVRRDLRAVYGPLVHPDLPWIWSNAGGIMCAVSLLHVSPREYLLLCGTAVGTQGHSGRHRAAIYDAVIAGDLHTYQAGDVTARHYGAGDLALLPRGQANGSHLGPGCWLLEYARGNVPSMFPFALADSLFSTLDMHDVAAQLRFSARLMLRHARSWARSQRLGEPLGPDPKALERLRQPGRTRSAKTLN